MRRTASILGFVAGRLRLFDNHGADHLPLFRKLAIGGFVIATIGCMHGLRVRGSAESVGQETTRAVVKGIFLVIVLDALFSVLFEKLGI